MTNENKPVEEIKKVQQDFRTKLGALRTAKDALLKLFRLKLEEKKIEEIKDSLRQ